MISATMKQRLEKQQYRFVGERDHSAVKVCGWTKKMLKGEGGCYKLKFYGIMSHQCMQMTTSMSCANRCTFCWRGFKAPVLEEWEGQFDDPEVILEESIVAHHKLLTGFNGHPRKQEAAYNASKTVKHVALSLTGEPIFYPKMNALIDKFHSQDVSTFLVTNGQYPGQIRDLHPVTQLYVSVDAPNKEILKKVDVPLFSDFWERLLRSLDYLKEKKQRTCLRLTLIKGENMCDLAGYAQLIERGDPDFLEVKGYMFVGASRQRLCKENMPFHEDVVAFSHALLKHLPDYSIVSEHIPSRVVMFAKKKYFVAEKWETWIDFSRFHALVNSKKDFGSLDYSCRTPQTGLSGRGTVENMKVDETTDELEFWSED